MSTILWGHGFFINHYYKIPKKKNQKFQHCHEFPNFYFIFWSLTLVGEEASMFIIMHGVENLGSRFSSMPLLNDLDALHKTHGRVH
jgi:hypothetical protein